MMIHKHVARWANAAMALAFSLLLTLAPPRIAAATAAGGGNEGAANNDQIATIDRRTSETLSDNALLRPGQPTVTGNKVPNIHSISDSLEPFSRSMWNFNTYGLSIITDPLLHGMRFILPEPVRKSIKRFGINLAYPVRLINTLLQGKAKGAGVETSRFLINTTVGVLGFFDPAKRWGLKPYNEDFGTTFAYYGMGSGTYIVLPIMGSSSGRELLALPFNSVLSPTFWLPGVGTLFQLNNGTFVLTFYERLIEMERDPYLLDRERWALVRKREVRDSRHGNPTPEDIEPPKTEPVPTLHAALLQPRDEHFQQLSKDRKVLIPATGHKLTYNLWLQKQPAPLVFVISGAGSHRISDSTLTMGELAWKRGDSVVTISSTMNWEFIRNASSAAVPGYTPVDARETYEALKAIYHDLQTRYPGRFTSTALLGLSLGGLHTLFIANQEGSQAPGDLHFDRYVAVNPPVDVIYALQKLDEYYNAPLEWPAAERQAKMEEALIKVSRLLEGKMKPSEKLPFDNIESRYLIGLNYRFILRDVISSSQQKQDLGVIPTANYSGLSRRRTYDLIARYSYIDYLRDFMVPYYLNRPDAKVTHEQFAQSANLFAAEPALRTNAKIRIYANDNDFLLRPSDIDWLKATMGNRVTVFRDGGHMGNLSKKEVQAQISEGLDGLKR